MAVLAGFGLLVLLLAVMVVNLASQLRELSTAASENMVWSISQLDTEFANLSSTLAEQVIVSDLTEAEVQLRVDIALSRLNIVNSGRAAALFGDNAQARDLIAPINRFAEQAIELSDRPGALVGEDLAQMHQLVKDVRPDVRRLALLGVSLGAEAAEARRAEFSRLLGWTGGTAIALMAAMAALLAVLNAMLRKAERRDAALLASSRQLASTVDASLDAIVIADESGRVVDYNHAAETVFGWPRAEILGRSMEETFIPHRMRDAHHNGMLRYLETGRASVVDQGRVELSALRKTGEEFPVELNITTTTDAEGTRFIAYIRDISARKIAEQTLIDARDRAERTDRAKSQFLTVMSHEMRTPLNGVLGVLDLLRTTDLDPAQQRYVQIATASSEMLLEHTNEALDITRIETGSLQIVVQPFDLEELVEGVSQVLEPLAREKGLELSVQIEDAMRVGFVGDAGRVRQILTNLVGNAIKFTDQGRIGLDVSGIHGPDETALSFAISDTGRGIAPEHHEQIFEDFVALSHGEGRQSRGDGLGLSISRRIAREMGGDIKLTSQVGEGAVFTLSLPLERKEKAQLKDPPKAAGTRQPGRTLNCLIVEDNTVNRKVLGDMLTGMGHLVSDAVNGLDGAKIASEQSFDVIFMDISMPLIDGIEATRQIRTKGGPNARTPIIGLTAHGREEYRDKAREAGMDRFHTKPIRLDALKGILANFGDGSHAPLGSAAPDDPFEDLKAALGADKLRSITNEFFAEFDALLEGAAGQDPADLGQAAHKVKGAASLLGQSDLAERLEQLEHQARAGKIAALDDRLAELKSCAEKIRPAMAARLDQGA